MESNDNNKVLQNKNIQIGTIKSADEFYIEVVLNGPYNVYGSPDFYQLFISVDEEGHSQSYTKEKRFDSAEVMRLCRCGDSENKPFCDGSHIRTKNNLGETASSDPLLPSAEIINGPNISLTDNESYCCYARFCDIGQRVWNEVMLEGEAHERMAIQIAHSCPGGRLIIWDNTRQKPIEEHELPYLGLIEDPALGVSGPIMVRGGVAVISATGKTYEIRNRQALCRCGQSLNKPFCDGTHASSGFNDELF